MSVPVTVRAVERVLVALLPDPDANAHARPAPPGAATTPTGGSAAGRGTISSGQRTVLAAEVLASWFGASLQFVTTDTAAADQLDALSGSIGLRTEPVTVLPSDGFDAALSMHADSHAPSLVVAAATPATLACAAANHQPTFLVPPGPKRRQPSGPLVVALPDPDDGAAEAALALATVWAQALDVPLVLSVPPDRAGNAGAGEVINRLEAMAIEVRPTADTDLARLASDGMTRPLAAVVPAAEVISAPVRQILATGGNVVAAPRNGASRRPEVDLDELHRLAQAIGGTSDDAEGLSAPECAALLMASTVGRLGYIDAGWPVVVPVNYSVHQGDIFIRTLRGGKLDAASRNDRVCFEIDTFDEAARTGASVLVHGRLEVISDPALLQTAWANDPSPFVDDVQMLWLRLAALSTTGRRIA